jgi:thiamine biosynthesis lipoprotein
MGTTFKVTVVAENIEPSELQRVQQLIEDELEEINLKMSHYREDTELSRFNRSHDQEPFVVSPETFEVFRGANEISLLTGGAFDVTAAPLIDLWGFGPEQSREKLPSDEDITTARDRTGYQKLVLDAASHSLRKLDPSVRCDLSAIAPGYAVDRVAEALAGEGFRDYLVEVGGEVRTAGTNAEGNAWRIGIERPVPGERVMQRIVPLSGMAMATSGGYRNFYERDGVRYSHTIDPRTGRPVTHNLASVTVVDALCARADGLATGLLVLGPEEGYALALEHDLAVLFIVAEGDGFRERATPAFEVLQKGVE